MNSVPAGYRQRACVAERGGGRRAGRLGSTVLASPAHGAQELVEHVPGDGHPVLAIGADVVDRSDVPRERFAFIVANPPYVAENDPHLGEGDLRFEPAGALISGEDGLDAMRAIVAKAPDFLGQQARLALEHGGAFPPCGRTGARRVGARGARSP